MGFLRTFMRNLLGAPDHVPTITPDQVIEMKGLYSQGTWTQEELARKFGIDQSQISRILSGKSHTP